MKARLNRQDLWILTAVLVVFMAVTIGRNWSRFAISYDRAEYERRYAQSQYVLGDARTHVMGDGDIYTYAGIRYVAGEDPTAVNFEHPPLAKYGFGLSYLLFGKPNWIMPLFMIIAFGAFVYIARNYFHTRWGMYAAMGLWLLHPVTGKFLTQTLLDFPLMSLTLASVAMYLYCLKHPKRWAMVAWGIGNGLLLSIKYPAPVTALLVGSLIVYYALKTKTYIPALMAAAVTGLTYLTTYAAYFTHQHNLIDWLKFEWWRWQWYQGKTDNPKGLLLAIIFKGGYKAWYTGTQQMVTYREWNLFWPAHWLLSLTAIPLNPRLLTDALLPYKIWMWATFGLYLLGADGDRMLVSLIPAMSLFGGYMVESLGLRAIKGKRR